MRGSGSQLLLFLKSDLLQPAHPFLTPPQLSFLLIHPPREQPAAWHALSLRNMSADVSWGQSAKSYVDVYRTIAAQVCVHVY